MPTRREIAAGLGLALGGLAPAGAVAAQAAGPAPADDVALATGFDLANRMTAPIQVDGLGPYDFVADTGADRSVIAAELAAALGLPEGPAARMHGIAGVEMARTARLRSLGVGRLVVRNLTAPVLPRARIGADGILGVDALRGRKVRLDFRGRRLEIGPSGGAAPRSLRTRLGREATVAARDSYGQMTVVDCEVDGVPVTAFVDTGAEATVANWALGRRLRQAPGRGTPVVLYGVNGQEVGGEWLPVSRLRLGAVALAQPQVVFADLHIFEVWRLADRPALLLGMNLLRGFAWVDLDFGGRLLTFRLAEADALGAGPVLR